MYLPIRLIIADDHEVYRDGLKTLLQKTKDRQLEVIGEASNGKELISMAETLKPDVVLTDIMMPLMDGIEATAHITQHMPDVRVIALSMFNQDNLILDMIHAGAKGYLIKNANKDEIIEAIDSVFKNQPYYCRSTSLKLARLIATSQLGNAIAKTKVTFSEKEIAVIRMICEEKSTKEISDKLFLSSRTVEEYRIKVRDKMGVKTMAGIVIYAIKNDLFRLD